MPGEPTDRWVVVPLTHGQVAVSSGATGAWIDGLSLTSPCRGSLVVAHRLLGAAASRLPLGRVTPRADPAVAAVAERAGRVADAANVSLGGARSTAVGLPRQAGRPHGVALVEKSDGERVFLKWSDDVAGIAVEADALERLDGGTAGYRVPSLVGRGDDDEGGWVATTALPRGRHRPCWAPDWESADSLVAKADPHPAGGHAAAHGDFAPWNVRRCGHDVWVIDWADMGHRPGGFDRLYFEVAARAMGRRFDIRPTTAAAHAAVGALIDERVAARAESLDLKMRGVLDRVEMC
jgi:hypothetical protein